MSSRRIARQYAFSVLVSVDGFERDSEDALIQYWDSMEFPEELNVEEQPLVKRVAQESEKQFAQELVLGVAEHLDEINQIILTTSLNWRLKRMAMADRNILRMGIFEILYRTDIPVKVSINEAIELAKIYGEASSIKKKGVKLAPQFVNGVLDKVAQKHRQEKK
jgi:N utilization substance protein B